MCKNKDHCGPQVVNWKTWLLSFLVPDDLWGVYIGDLCEVHDMDYARGGTEENRKEDDQQFKNAVFDRIYKELKTKGDPKASRKASLGSEIYYVGVRVGGKAQYNFHDKES